MQGMLGLEVSSCEKKGNPWERGGLSQVASYIISLIITLILIGRPSMGRMRSYYDSILLSKSRWAKVFRNKKKWSHLFDIEDITRWREHINFLLD